MADQFSHLNQDGTPNMVNVGGKTPTHRMAKARAIVELDDLILEKLENNDIQSPKGSVFQIATIAGIMAAKQTGNLIPLCHPIGMDSCDIHIYIGDQKEVIVDCEVQIFAKTGVEMEALTGASVAALTIYDMCKAFSHNIIIKEVKLMEKRGGKRDFKRNKDE